MLIRKFVNREDEMDVLEEQWEQEGFGFFILYGRRRIGKTMLIKRFLEERSGIYYLSDKRGTIKNLDRFNVLVSKHFNLPVMKIKSFSELFGEIAARFGKERMILAIDEFPYLVEKDREITSEFQYIMDEILVKTNWMIIICGSSVSVMEESLLSVKSPLYGRRTGQLKLSELNIHELGYFLPKYSFEDLVRTYGALGGVPRYLTEFDPGLGFQENVRRCFFGPGNFLYEEANLLLRDELREPATYFNILEQMSRGYSKLTDLANASYIASKDIYKYLQVLMRLDIIERFHPITRRGRTKISLYQISDKYFRFWFRFILPNRQHIEYYDPAPAFKDFSANYERYMGPVFEDIVRSIFPVLFPDISQKVGKWWHRGREIDIVALDEGREKIVFCECKWTNRKIGKKIFFDLKEKAKHVDWRNDARKEEYCIISRGGFTSGLRELIDNEDDVTGLDLVDIERILSRK